MSIGGPHEVLPSHGALTEPSRLSDTDPILVRKRHGPASPPPGHTNSRRIAHWRSAPESSVTATLAEFGQGVSWFLAAAIPSRNSVLPPLDGCLTSLAW